MPELPEVECFLNYLNKEIKNEKIKSFKIFYPKLIKKNGEINTFKEKLINNRIEEIKRHGKYLVFFIGENALITHLRMEGNFYVTSPQELFSEHCLIQFNFTNENKCLRFRDSRRFGTFDLADKNNYQNHKTLKKLGLEPFDIKLTPSYLKEKWKNRKINIKKALLEQKVICGIGNIYACEILFECKISPFKKINTLNEKELQKIIKNTKKILKEAIIAGGSIISTYEINGHNAKFQTKLKVYGRRAKKCFECEKIISWKKIGGRGTFFCLNCQVD